MSYFGTDGIRGKFGSLPIHPEFLLKLGFATGQVLLEHDHIKKQNAHRPSVVIGKDTRLSGYVIEACLQAGFNASGVDVHMLGVIPTPAIAHLTRSFHADAGVVISASHNPFYDNGVKFFSSNGKKLSDELQTKINDKLASLDDAPLVIDGLTLGRHYRVDDAKGRYIEFCKGSFPYHLNLQNLKIVVDCANGAGYSVAPRVLAELGATVVAIGDTPNGTNINDHVGSTHIQTLQQKVIEEKADLGLALDGDGDRILMVDEHGQVVDGDAILYILATQSEQKATGVVGTLMSNMGLQLALQSHDIRFVRAKVGDRYVMQALDDNGWHLGGEPSGHILTLDKASTGDAIVAGLQVLAIMAKTSKTLSQLTTGFEVLPQVLVNVRLNHKQDPYDNPKLAKLFADTEQSLHGTGRLLIRQSGTEPLIRVMVESCDKKACDHLANTLAQAIQDELG